MIVRVLLMIGLSVTTAAAQEDPMDLQRCIWRCLADSSGASDPKYHQCVEAVCDTEVEAATPDPDPIWRVGPTADGQGYYAGQVDRDTGNTLHFTCDATGARNLILSGEVEGPSATLTLEVDGIPSPLWFEAVSGVYFARLDAPLLDTLIKADTLTLFNGINTALGRFPMAGGGAAISSALAACGG